MRYTCGRLFTLFLFVLAAQNLYSQLFEFQSLGYNTREIKSLSSGRLLVKEYFLVNSDTYSNWHIYDTANAWQDNSLRFEESINGRVMVQSFCRSYYVAEYFISENELAHKITFSSFFRSVLSEEEHTIIDNRITEFQTKDGSHIERSTEIAESENGVRITTVDNNYGYSGSREPGRMEFYFYNSDPLFVVEIFLHRYTELCKTLLQADKNNYLRTYKEDYERNNEASYIIRFLRCGTAEELAILRNCIFAKYGYNFQTRKWLDFFNTYYASNYRGALTNSEVLALLTEEERWLLNLILQYER
ncbi:MAG: YARHG domain-containing protein [Spirochaetaceae bacterium]|nr:YARHG domain-containing protein [Spirochaetaceae bacterium]